MSARPIDIAKSLNISSSALRHYEAWSIIPSVERGANGYRVYTDMHIAYFECIRAMHSGFGMGKTIEVLHKSQSDAWYSVFFILFNLIVYFQIRALDSSRDTTQRAKPLLV